MVRLILTLTPVVCMLGGIAMSVTFDHYLKTEDQETGTKAPQVKTTKAKGIILINIILIVTEFSGESGKNRRS